MNDTGAENDRRGRPRASLSFDPERLARLMVVAGVDADKLAADAGVSRATVVRARMGKALSHSTVRKLGTALAKYPKSEVVDELLREPQGVA